MSNYLASNTDLESVANAIRTKGGTSAQLAFPAGFVQAIGDIETGGNSPQIVTGTFTGDDTAVAKFTCSFVPDVVYVKRINMTALSNRVFAGFMGGTFGDYVGYAMFQNNANTTAISQYDGGLTNKKFYYTNGQVCIDTMSSRPVSSNCEYAYFAIKWTT